MPLARAMARFAIDRKRLIVSSVLAVLLVVFHGDLTAMAVLAIGEFSERSEDAIGRPVGEISLQRDLLADRRPALIAAQLHKPKPLPADVVERQEAHRTIFKFAKERLRAPSIHVPAADGGIHLDFDLRQALLLDHKYVLAALIFEGRNDCIFELERPAVEAGNDFGFTRRAAGAAMRRFFPQTVLFRMASSASLRPDKIVELRHSFLLRKQRGIRRTEAGVPGTRRGRVVASLAWLAGTLAPPVPARAKDKPGSGG